MNGNEVYNKMFKVINEQGSNYFSGERFISFVKEVDENFPDYSDYIKERQLEGKSTSRKDFFRDIFLSFSDEQRIDFAKRVEKETHSAYSENSEDLYYLLYGKRLERMKDDIDRNNVFGNAFSDIFSPTKTVQKKSHNMETKVNPRNVFVVHGRNHKVRDAMFDFLRSIDLRPIEWDEAIRETGEGSPTIPKILEAGFSMAQVAIILMTPDDEAKLRDEFIEDDDGDDERVLTPQPRPNVIFEAGMAMGKYPERTILVEAGKIRLISDILGRHIIRISDTPEMRKSLVSRLETAGCSTNTRGTGWLSAGNFNLQKEIQSSSSVSSMKPANKANSQTKSNNLRIKRTFSDLDRDEFKNEAFEFIANYFEKSLKDLEKNNSHVKTKFSRINTNQFSATVYVDNSQKNICRISLNDVKFSKQAITYSEGNSIISGINDYLSVTDDGHELFLKSLNLHRFLNGEFLTKQQAAEHYWDKFLEPLQR